MAVCPTSRQNIKWQNEMIVRQSFSLPFIFSLLQMEQETVYSFTGSSLIEHCLCLYRAFNRKTIESAWKHSSRAFFSRSGGNTQISSKQWCVSHAEQWTKALIGRERESSISIDPKSIFNISDITWVIDVVYRFMLSRVAWRHQSVDKNSTIYRCNFSLVSIRFSSSVVTMMFWPRSISFEITRFKFFSRCNVDEKCRSWEVVVWLIDDDSDYSQWTLTPRRVVADFIDFGNSFCIRWVLTAAADLIDELVNVNVQSMKNHNFNGRTNNPSE